MAGQGSANGEGVFGFHSDSPTYFGEFGKGGVGKSRHVKTWPRHGGDACGLGCGIERGRFKQGGMAPRQRDFRVPAAAHFRMRAL